MSPKKALQAAIKSMGSQKQLASAIRVRPSTLNYWVLRGRPAAEHVLAIEYVSGISRHDLRPDLYPRNEAADD